MMLQDSHSSTDASKDASAGAWPRLMQAKGESPRDSSRLPTIEGSLEARSDDGFQAIVAMDCNRGLCANIL